MRYLSVKQTTFNICQSVSQISSMQLNRMKFSILMNGNNDRANFVILYLSIYIFIFPFLVRAHLGILGISLLWVGLRDMFDIIHFPKEKQRKRILFISNWFLVLLCLVMILFALYACVCARVCRYVRKTYVRSCVRMYVRLYV